MKHDHFHNESLAPEENRWCRYCQDFKVFTPVNDGEFYRCEKCCNLIINPHHKRPEPKPFEHEPLEHAKRLRDGSRNMGNLFLP